MKLVSVKSREQRNLILGFAIPDLSTVDYGQIRRMDVFYLECQKYRDYYRDPHNKIGIPPIFKEYQGKCGVKLDTSEEKLKHPLWVAERKPVMYPDYEVIKNNEVSYSSGRYNHNSDKSYKR
ncbi:hypothetical protein KR009_009980 [Drosophila setifemur]|nr:hypothetical protein KR009_009980 [Drosophila setifemur]